MLVKYRKKYRFVIFFDRIDEAAKIMVRSGSATFE